MKVARMDAIKKKMVALREETDRAVTKANGSEAARNEANSRADEWEEKQRKWQKRQWWTLTILKKKMGLAEQHTGNHPLHHQQWKMSLRS